MLPPSLPVRTSAPTETPNDEEERPEAERGPIEDRLVSKVGLSYRNAKDLEAHRQPTDDRLLQAGIVAGLLPTAVWRRKWFEQI